MTIRKPSMLLAGVLVATSLLGIPSTAQAAVGDHGVDNAVYQGAYGKFGYAKDKFMVSQIGGYTGYGTYDQSTYATQVQSAIAQGKRAHTYVWWQNITDYATADAVLDHFLPKVQTPKGSIVALDIESGGQNTDVIMHALDRIKAAGYTPMVYGYKNYLVQNTDLNRIADKYQLWLAEYPNYEVTPEPNYNYFPSFKNVGIFQFTSTYVAGGLDGNIDLTGITDSGYKNGDADKPKTDTPATDAGKEADNTPKKDVSVGDTVKVNFSSSKWATGENIPDFIKGKSYTVKQIDGKKLLLDGVMSWINRSDAELISVGSTVPANPTTPSNQGTYTVKYGDSFWSIANAHGMNMYTLASINGLSINSVIYPGQVLRVSGAATSTPSASTYVVKSGDTLSYIAYKFGTTVQAIANASGISNPNYLYVGQVLHIPGASGVATSRSYTVKYGDNLSSIANNLGISWVHLANANGISAPYIIQVGQVLSY